PRLRFIFTTSPCAYRLRQLRRSASRGHNAATMSKRVQAKKGTKPSRRDAAGANGAARGKTNGRRDLPAGQRDRTASQAPMTRPGAGKYKNGKKRSPAPVGTAKLR